MTEAFIERTQRRYREDGYAVPAVVVRDSGRLAGWAGLSVPWFLPEILPAVEVGWRLREQSGGFGYATEAGRAWVDYGFEVRGLGEIVSTYEPENVASGVVMVRLGFVLDLETVHPERGQTIHVTCVPATYWIRERRRWAIGEAIRRLTSDTADLFGIGDRGRLEPGAFADVNVIDFDGLHLPAPTFEHDFPNGAGRYVQAGQDYDDTLVNGEVFMDQGVHSGVLAGQMLRAVAVD